MKFLHRIIIPLALSFMAISPSLADDYLSPYSFDSIPTFREALCSLNQKKILYNTLSDSLYLEENEASWIDFVKRRSSINYNNYIENQKALDDIIYYFLVPQKGKDPTSANLELRNNIHASAYDSLWVALDANYRLSDPFITEEIVGNILIPYYSNLDEDKIDSEHHKLLAHLYLNYGDALYQIYHLGDESALKKSYEMMKLALSEIRGFDRGENGWIYGYYAMAYILSNQPLIDTGNGMGEDFLNYHNRFKQYYIEYYDAMSDHYLWNYYATMINMAFNYKVLRLRDMILNTDPADAEANEEIEQHLEKFLADKEHELSKKHLFKHEWFSTEMVLLAKAGKISYNEAFNQCREMYKNFRATDFTSLSLFNRAFRCYVNSAQDMLYLIDNISFMPRKEKELFATMLLAQGVELLNVRPKRSSDTRHTSLFALLIKDKRLIKYTPASTRFFYAEQCLKVLSIHTLVHSHLVNDYSQIMLDAVYDQCPELLIGVLGTTSLQEVNARKKEIKDFLEVGCKFHDVGKILIEQIVNNEFRRLTDHEFSIIKTHAENSSIILSIDASYKPYSQFALGHHKWYNGKKGYPVWYDNVIARDRVLVDIVTIADCLEAATNFMSRNYRRSKAYGTLIEEFKEEAGTRYSPDIVNAILKSKKYNKKLEKAVLNSNSFIYNDIFKDY